MDRPLSDSRTRNSIEADLRPLLEGWVGESGLVLLGIIDPEVDTEFPRFQKWLKENKHAEMGFLCEHQDCRKDPNKILPGAKAVVVIGLPYGQSDDSEGPKVAQYARFRDYHRVLKERGERIAKKLLGNVLTGDQYVTRVVVDTAPVLERALAAKTPGGFIGKNTCFIHEKRGSFLLLGEIFTSLPLMADENGSSEKKRCGDCQECQKQCPTGALNEEYQLDSKKCLAYWTIEHRGVIPKEYWTFLKYYYYGCDLCQICCPYNHKKEGYRLPESIELRTLPSLFEVATMDEKQYQKYFGGTPMTRAKRNGLRRNALIAMTVTKDCRLKDAIELAKRDAPYPIEGTIYQIEEYLLRKMDTTKS